jgi:hypothetical protein
MGTGALECLRALASSHGPQIASSLSEAMTLAARHYKAASATTPGAFFQTKSIFMKANYAEITKQIKTLQYYLTML